MQNICGHFLKTWPVGGVILGASQIWTTLDARTPSPTIANDRYRRKTAGSLVPLDTHPQPGSNHCPAVIKAKYLPDYQAWPGSRY